MKVGVTYTFQKEGGPLKSSDKFDYDFTGETLSFLFCKRKDWFNKESTCETYLELMHSEHYAWRDKEFSKKAQLYGIGLKIRYKILEVWRLGPYIGVRVAVSCMNQRNDQPELGDSGVITLVTGQLGTAFSLTERLAIDIGIELSHWSDPLIHGDAGRNPVGLYFGLIYYFGGDNDLNTDEIFKSDAFDRFSVGVGGNYFVSDDGEFQTYGWDLSLMFRMGKLFRTTFSLEVGYIYLQETEVDEIPHLITGVDVTLIAEYDLTKNISIAGGSGAMYYNDDYEFDRDNGISPVFNFGFKYNLSDTVELSLNYERMWNMGSDKKDMSGISGLLRIYF